jgi:uncharacterized protein YidB (DUF937 family)
MGLFDSLTNLAGGLLGAENGSPAAQLAGPVMAALQQNGINGVGDLVQQFQQGGFAAHAASWVGNGQNQPIEANAIQQVLGQPVLADLAAKFGVDPQQASSLLAQHLPDIISHLTPNGQVPAQS